MNGAENKSDFVILCMSIDLGEHIFYVENHHKSFRDFSCRSTDLGEYFF